MSRLEFALKMREEHPEYYFPNYGVTSHVDPSVHVPEWVEIGEGVIIHRGVILGTTGAGYAWDNKNSYIHIPHIGKLIIEDDVEILSGSNLGRGTIYNTIIGKGTKIDALCHIAHNSQIGENCILTAGVIIAGSVTLGDRVYVGINSSIKDHVAIADRVFIGQGSNVVEDITIPDSVWVGNPARYLRGRRIDE